MEISFLPAASVLADELANLFGQGLSEYVQHLAQQTPISISL